MKEHKPGPSLGAQVLLILLILGSLFGILWPVVRDARGPRGDPIPSQPPEESRRIRHPLGYSIVAPPNWGHHISFDAGPLMLAPRTPGRYARRSTAIIVVSQLGRRRPEDLERLHPTSFQGAEAYEDMKVVRPWTFDDGAWSEYHLYLSHDGDWYEVRYGVAEERTRLPGEVRRYLETLRWAEAK